jgi:class 3 adenylate cyclase/tetratricopeptide (TPR) repeat protein
MAIGAIATDLSVYLPKWVIVYLRQAGVSNEAPFVQRVGGAVLFLDIAGFTEKTDKLAQRGARGAEELSNLLDDCFARLTSVLNQHGGDIIAFAGDGFVGFWESEDVNYAAHLAAQCGLALQEVMDSWARASGNELRQRISIEIGEIYRCKVGGFRGRWHFLVVGTPIQRVGAAYRQAQVGEVVLCDAASRALAQSCEGETYEGLYRLTRLKSRLPLERPVVALEIPIPSLENFIPKVVIDGASFGDRRWLGEFRNVSILYINLLDIKFDESLLPSLQCRILEIQRISARLEGAVHHLIMDDKGVTIALGFGMPPYAHEDDPLRAVEGALAVRLALGALDIRTSIGVASGRLFCGDYGGQSRREYCLIGQAINSAARLMEMADGEVLCDSVTARAVNERVTFSVLPALHVKGRIEPVPAFRPMTLLRSQPRSTGATYTIGREHERAELRRWLKQGRSRKYNLLIVKGEAGIGKSQLLADLMETAENDGCSILRGFASALDKSTLYFAWRNVLAQLLEIAPNEDPIRARAKLYGALHGQPTLLSWLPLLCDIVPLGFSETALTEQITGAARAASIEELIIHLLRETAHRADLLVFEDLHWFDGASIALLAAVARRLPHLPIVASARVPDSVDASELPSEIIAGSVINLDALPREFITEIIARRLRVTQVPAALADFVYQHAGGNPFYSEELVLALRDTGAVSVVRETCRIASDLSEAALTGLSASLEGAIVSRVDALPAEDRVILKVASAVGEAFTAQMLQSIYPEPREIGSLETTLGRLVNLDMLRFRERDPTPNYVFRHAISQEVTYNLLSFEQRRTLHRRIATSLERLHAGRLEPLFARLAQHWERAEDSSRAVGYLEMAAEQSLRNYSNLDAIRYVGKAFQLAEQAGLNDDIRRITAWEVIVGDAYHELSDYDEASAHYGAAMLLLGRRLPQNRAERLFDLLRNSARQLTLRLLQHRPETLAADVRVNFQMAAHIYERLSEEYFFLNDSVGLLNGTIASLNFAERAGSTAETINGFNALGLGLGMVGYVGAARFYSRRALRLAEQRGKLPDVARAELVAGVLMYGLGKWDLVDQRLERAATLYKTLGDRARWQDAQTISIFVAILRGVFERADTLLADLAATISSDSSVQVRAWDVCSRVLIGSMRGHTDSLQLKELRDLAAGKLAPADQLLCLGIIASAYLQQKEMPPALEAAKRGLALLAESKVVWGGYVYGAAGVVEVLLAHWARVADGRVQDTKARQNALAACNLLSRVARTSPVCRPRALLLRGRMAFLSGSTDRARNDWRSAVAMADRLQMPQEVGLALYEIGRTSASNDPGRSLNLVRAAEIFERLGVTADLDLAREALSD